VKKQLSTILIALLVVGSAAATGVLIQAQTKESGLNDVAFFAYKDGKLAAAERLYLAALEQNPGYALARYNLATLYFEEKRFDDAIPQLALLEKADPQNPHYHYDLAVNLVENIRQNSKGLDQFDRALSEYREAERLSPGFEHVQENIAVLEQIKAEYGIE
jgi:tetratricopeptide (TPR) repeat protein